MTNFYFCLSLEEKLRGNPWRWEFHVISGIHYFIGDGIMIFLIESDYWLYSNSSFSNRFWCLFYKSFGEHISLIGLPLLNNWKCSSVAMNRKPTIRALRHSGKEHVKAASKPTTHHHMRNVFLELRKVSPKTLQFPYRKVPQQNNGKLHGKLGHLPHKCEILGITNILLLRFKLK